MITKNVYHPIWDNILYYALIIVLILLVITVTQRPGKIRLATSTKISSARESGTIS